MRRSISCAFAIVSLFIAAEAHADPTYSEARVEGGSVVTFEKDSIAGGGPSALGDTIRRPPGAIRVGLIRPRFNFVPELLKSVENL